MKNQFNKSLTRIGVFYDGNYYLHVSNYYNYGHARRSRISVSGLHQFIRHKVAEASETDVRLCHIVDAHFFRGRLNAQDASQRNNQLYYDRVFDDILMSEGVITHYLPLKNFQGNRQEKGIDVWLALEAFELAQFKQFDVLVLITSDGDYLPLIRKLNTLGTKVMLISWDFEFTNDMGKSMVTRTSQDLLQEATFPIPMHDIIEAGLNAEEPDPIITNMFVQFPSSRSHNPGNGYHAKDQDEHQEESAHQERTIDPDAPTYEGSILSIKKGFGFIKYPPAPNNLFFHFSYLLNPDDFNKLREGDVVQFNLDYNDKQELIAVNIRNSEEDENSMDYTDPFQADE
jgi:uncharacterized LabA/DUF88 family protein/cold shock CspA family protein